MKFLDFDVLCIEGTVEVESMNNKNGDSVEEVDRARAMGPSSVEDAVGAVPRLSDRLLRPPVCLVCGGVCATSS